MRHLILSIVLSVLAFSTPAAAESDNFPDRAAIETLISAQMRAFEADDAAAAFAFASPDLQAKFGNPATFMDMVRAGYAPVYRPRAVEFRDLVPSPAGLDQQVFVIGPDGRAYLAHYMMEPQPDGSWRIGGCYLEPLGEESV
ncbi:MAG: DUF4864 domain-containing protein [Rhodospirillaceae bacterium]|nr:DUF4864 domain-containing protein [Rhodospirillaceae bacterium]